MSKNSINGVETTVRDDRGFNIIRDAHSFEFVYQKTNLSTDDFYNQFERITDVCCAEMVEMFTSSITSYVLRKTILTATDSTRGACHCSSRRTQLHTVFYQRDAPDEMRTPWKLPA